MTAKWWSDVWLHEAFATYLEYTGPDHMYPDWNMVIFSFIKDSNYVASLTQSYKVETEI